MSYVLELLEKEFQVTVYFFNPNIMPLKEYSKRLEEIQEFSRIKGFHLIIEDGDARSWVEAVKDYKYYGEKSERCRICYNYRLEKTFETAKAGKFDIVATTLSISPHKSAPVINELGKALSLKYGIEFFEADFKKNDGFKKSAELSKEYGFYRQNYCGCIYSKLERIKDSPWSKKISEEREKRESAEYDDSFPDTGDEIDLHHFHPADTKKVVEFYLARALEKRYSNVRIIHGKGKSRKKKEVHDILRTHPGVVSFNDDSWNWGSTIVHLTI